jgi:hypothetical protein
VTVGKPNSDKYTEVNVDEYQVHFFQDARLAPEVVIDAPGIGIFRKLHVTGIIL